VRVIVAVKGKVHGARELTTLGGVGGTDHELFVVVEDLGATSLVTPPISEVLVARWINENVSCIIFIKALILTTLKQITLLLSLVVGIRGAGKVGVGRAFGFAFLESAVGGSAGRKERRVSSQIG
jgi:hypothetical protein